MTTVDKEFADNIARNKGFYNGEDDNSLGDNPRVVKIVKYKNAWGGDSYGLVYEGIRDKYVATEFVNNPITYWALEAQTDDSGSSPKV